MKVVVGLGNPGNEYQETRHNIGFMVVDALAKELNISLDKNKFKGQIGEGFLNGEKIILVKPMTYMNLSGETVGPLLSWYKLDRADLLVVYDDMDLSLGQLRIRRKGSSGGHNGMKSIIAHLNTEDFSRLKIGIGSPRFNVINYVLGKFEKDEKQIVEEAINRAVEAAKVFLTKGVQEAMNKYN